MGILSFILLQSLVNRVSKLYYSLAYEVRTRKRIDAPKGNKDSKNSEADIDYAATGGSVMDVGDTSRDITDTADVARASITKGRGAQGSRTAADIAKGQTESDESVIQGTATVLELH
jgi:hypothetical protein